MWVVAMAPQQLAPGLRESGRPSRETSRTFNPVRVRSYEDLRVWQSSMRLVMMTYRLTSAFPVTERYGLASQMRRAAVSIPANIAEGHGRRHLGDKLRHFSVANGSLKELETEARIARQLGYLSPTEGDGFARRAASIGRMMTVLTTRLRGLAASPTTHNRQPTT